MKQDDIPGTGSRRAALRLLDAVLNRGQPLEMALDGATRNLSLTADRALARAIASEVIRRLRDLDDLIDGAMRKPLPTDAKARMVLRIALVQALILKTPHHAAIATALPLVEKGPRRLVHGVLGALLRGDPELPTLPALPEAVELRWEKAWGKPMVAAAQARVAHHGVLDLTLKNYAETESWRAKLGGESLLPGHIRLETDTPVTELPGYTEGDWWVQNLAASLPARLLAEGAGRSVLDLCAAPGGKTLQLAAQGWQVTAVEANARRIDRMKENLERTGLTAEILRADILKWQAPASVDAIILDAPCSATGIFARHPEVLHRVRPGDIAAFAKTQAAMLARAAQWLKPGGTLIYATCSLEPEEGERIVSESGLKVEGVEDSLLPDGVIPTGQGWLRILPHHNMDGFFVAALTRC